MEVAALEECERVACVEGEVTPEDVTSLLAACAPALSSPAVAEDFLTTITDICCRTGAYSLRVVCGASGVIPCVVDAMSKHRPSSVIVSVNGCAALGLLALGNTANADAIVISAGALDVICSAMASHAGEEEVQKAACGALCQIADAASPPALAALREGRAAELVKAARVNHPQEGMASVRDHADEALAKLTA